MRSVTEFQSFVIFRVLLGKNRPEKLMGSGGGGGSIPLLQDFFVKNIGILYAYDF